MSVFARLSDRLFGQGEYAVTVPAMDGALLPNNSLEEGHIVARVVRPDNMISFGEGLALSSGKDLLQLRPSDGFIASRQSFQSDISALAAHPQAGLAVALDDGEIVLSGAGPVRTLSALKRMGLHCVTAVEFQGAETLIVCNGSAAWPASAWTVDLMERNASGSVWQIDIAKDEALCIARDLAYPSGLLVRSGEVVVSEAWRHRLIGISSDGSSRSRILLSDLPGYPGRLTAQDTGGAYLCVFAPRNQLIEFVLQERAYRRRMMRELAPEYWVAPSLSSGRSFLEPLQGGAVKQMGILKPWAPSRSYGLVVSLDEDMQPVASFHSRADGTRHGTTSAVSHGGRLYVTSKGGDLVIVLDAVD